jgi:hypothetical protein
LAEREIEDIKFHNRTKYNLKVSEMTTDYIDTIKEFRDIAQDGEWPKQAREILSKKIKDILDKDAKSKKRNDDPRKRRELLEGGVAVTKTVYVEREDDGDAILGKAFDFSRTTIDDLPQKGYGAGEDAYTAKRRKSKNRPQSIDQDSSNRVRVYDR